METTRNLAMVFALALRSAARDIRAATVASTEHDDTTRITAIESIEAVADELEQFAQRERETLEVANPHLGHLETAP